jgi:hypothetical protein
MKRMILALLLLSACQTTGAKNDRVIRFVDEIVFGGAFDGHLPQDKKVTRWSGDIRVRVSGVTTGELDALVLERLQEISQVVGVPIARVEKGGPQNLTVNFVEELDFEVNRERAPCFARITEKRNHEISRAEVYISVAEPDIIEHCIDHELMHVFGFRYHSSILLSTLSPFHSVERITAWDEIALSVLFDPRVTPGAERGQVFPVIQDIVRERLRTR